MQYLIVGNDIALIMHYRALLKRSGIDQYENFNIGILSVANNLEFFYRHL